MKMAINQILFIMICLSPLVLAYRPVVLVHGLFGDSDTWNSTRQYILDEHPGTNITISRTFRGIQSVTTDLWTQVKGLYKEVGHVLTAEGDGAILICYSQGGIVCRGLIETYSDLNIHTFISLSAPLAGQYGLTKYIAKYTHGLCREDVYKILYNPISQQKISIANYWNDPFHQDLFQEYCIYLPKLNNCTKSINADCKTNFLKLKQVVLVGGPDDGVITPYESSHFGFYAENSTDIVPIRETKIYKQDMFGLKTLDEAEKLKIYNISNVEHLEWAKKQSVYECCIKPWLK